MKAYIDKIHYNNNKVPSKVNNLLRYFKLPYIGKYSQQVQKKIKSVNSIAKKINCIHFI